jgi:hypothetical protein
MYPWCRCFVTKPATVHHSGNPPRATARAPALHGLVSFVHRRLPPATSFLLSLRKAFLVFSKIFSAKHRGLLRLPLEERAATASLNRRTGRCLIEDPVRREANCGSRFMNRMRGGDVLPWPCFHSGADENKDLFVMPYRNNNKRPLGDNHQFYFFFGGGGGAPPTFS